MQNVFHEGELKVQRMAGEQQAAERNSAMIANRIMRGALPFLAAQSMAVLGSTDAAGHLWASLLFGTPGFLQSADGLEVNFDLTKTIPDANDPFWTNITQNPSVGMLVIELSTRRRLRINGSILRSTTNQLKLHVEESYPNCPKYITRRNIEVLAAPLPQDAAEKHGQQLGVEQTKLLRRADMLFLATSHPTRGTDASHRGGSPGFIEVLDARTFRIPDYPGNGLFNTLGNLVLHPSAGITVPDFARGRLLQLTGTADCIFTDNNAERFLVFHVDAWREAAMPARTLTEPPELSPFNPTVSRG